jgi:hypothetical protein
LTADVAHESMLEMNQNFILRAKTRKIRLWSLNRLIYFLKNVVASACDAVRECIITKTCMSVCIVEILITENAFLCDLRFSQNC